MTLTGNAMAATYLLDSKREVIGGIRVSEILLTSIMKMNKEDMAAFKYYSEHGTFLNLNDHEVGL